MSPAMQAMLSGGLSFGAVLLIALNELRTLRRHRGGDDEGPRRAAPVPPCPGPGGARALPACLVPNENWHVPSRRRTRELA